MTYDINETHDPQLRSWVESANAPDTDFPIQNLPFGIFNRKANLGAPSIGVRIGDAVLDLKACHNFGLLGFEEWHIIAAFAAPRLNELMALEPNELMRLRAELINLLRADRVDVETTKAAMGRCLVDVRDVYLHLPAEIGDYTDFYASIYHATNVGRMFRPDNPLLPNYKYVPIGYHGRASSIVASGASVRRPLGQLSANENEPPTFAASKNLDYEMEVGFFVGRGNEPGERIAIEEAQAHIFGAVLVNDWSARDIQKWEYQPLGPFLAKNFGTSISPWIVTMEALAPFRTQAFERPVGDPVPLPYLASEEETERGGIDMNLEVYLSSAQMRDEGHEPVKLSTSNLRDMYWTPAQMLTHHASNGCAMRPGDLFASGTVSGAGETERGCLLEITQRGARPVELPTGETRRFLEDEDEVIMRGYCQREGFARIGFGVCRGVVLPAA